MKSDDILYERNTIRWRLQRIKGKAHDDKK